MEEFDPDEATARALDDDDPLSGLRERFHLPEGVYLEGNSLGPLAREAEAALDRAVGQWRELGIGGWTEADPPWFHYGERLGDRLAPLVGADADEVVATGGTTVNIHALLSTFYDPARPKVVVDELDFPTDHYAIRSWMRLHGVDPGEALVVVESRDGHTVEEEDIVAAIDDGVGLVFLPSVLYRSGQLLDVERLTRAAHDRGALAGFDLAHSIGVVPHELSAHGVDFAVWCSYKYLNAGPGAIGGLYVNRDHFGRRPGLAGWWGHEKETQFEMNLRFTPAEGAGAWQIGTPPILSAAPLFGTLDLLEETSIGALRGKSLRLTSYLIALADERLAEHGVEVGTPRDPERRGGHVALSHTEAYPISRALGERGVVVDFRPPDVVRMAPSPMYTGYHDIWRAVDALRSILDGGEHERFAGEAADVT